MPERAAISAGSQAVTVTILGSHLRRAGGRVWSGGLVKLIGEFGFSAEAARAALARLVLGGMLERHRDGRLVDYALTPQAEDLFAEGDKRIFGFGRGAPGADAWTFLWHMIPEARRVERSRFASRLRFLGFGSLQDATWIAAADRAEEVRGLADRLGVGGHVSIFLARMSRGSENAVLASGAWDLDDLAPRYREFVTAFGPLAEAPARRALTDREAFLARVRLTHSFRDFSLVDPELPDTIAPLHELRARTVAVFDSAYRGLEESAERHFEEVAGIGVGHRR